MPVEPLGPCPCGSGQNYQECHSRPGRPPPDACRVNRAIAGAGETGRFRTFFARQYAEFKQHVIEDIQRTQRERVAARNGQITCQRGCIHCCKVYVFATLEEAECIVYYLYAHQEKLDDFLCNFRETWSRDACIQQLLPLHHQLQTKIICGDITVEEQVLFDRQQAEYARRGMRCPFLTLDDACSIYPVRPFVCAGLVATTPAEYCALDYSDAGVDFCRVTVNRQAANMPYFLKKPESEAFGCLPDIVYKLLVRGYGALEELTANRGLFQRVAGDPEVKAILTALGAALPE